MVGRLNIMIDLFAGLGGASQAFYDSPDWFVIRIDNNPILLEHTHGLILSDITNVDRTMSIIERLILNVHEDSIRTRRIDKLVVWASPPCNQYSFANGINLKPHEYDNTCVEAALEIIDRLQPNAWIIENVKGAIETFDQIIGMKWVQSVGSIFLWGQFPILAFDDAKDRWHKKNLEAGSRALRPNIRAIVPYGISKAYMSAVMCQTKITSFCANAEQDA